MAARFIPSSFQPREELEDSALPSDMLAFLEGRDGKSRREDNSDDNRAAEDRHKSSGREMPGFWPRGTVVLEGF